MSRNSMIARWSVLFCHDASKSNRRETYSTARPLAALSLLLLAMLSSCQSDRDPGSLAAPTNHLAGVDRGSEGGSDGLRGGVNAYLWRGAIDTLSFMPLSSADAVGGVILTDWYQPPSSPHERFKIAAYVLDRRLRSDALRVAVFRQTTQGGAWQDVPVSGTTTSDIATRILARARQLRSENGEQAD